MVDLTPEALQNRMKRGDVYSTEKVERSLKNFFRRGNLIALRELALRQVAEQSIAASRPTWKIRTSAKNWGVRERMAVCISANPAGQYLIARGTRMARRMDAELYVVHVDRDIGPKESNQAALAANLRFAENLGAKVVRLRGPQRRRFRRRVRPLQAHYAGNLGPRRCTTGENTSISPPFTVFFESPQPSMCTS